MSGALEILLVEDDDADALLFRGYLKSSSHRTHQVRSLEEAQEIASANRIDIAFTDLEIDDSQGLETFESLKRILPAIPIIILTGDTQSHLTDLDGCTAQNFINKSSLNEDRLEIEIRFALQRHHFEGELKEAKRIAEQANQYKSEFLAHFSHEIRTPLNAVIGMLELLRESGLNSKQEDLLSNVEIGGERLLAIVNDILDVSKIEAGQMEAHDEEFNLRDLTCDCLCMFAPEATRKGIVLADLIDPEVPAMVTADPRRLRQILGNYLSNAMKYTETGHIFVRVSLEESQKLRFSVVDSGCGITPEEARKLFEPFTQSNPEDTYRGTGLGLAVVKSLAELLGGKAGAQPHSDGGSDFWFTIELKQTTKKKVKRSLLEGVKVSIHIHSDSVRMLLQQQLASRQIDTEALGQDYELAVKSAPGTISCILRSADGKVVGSLSNPLCHAQVLQMLAQAEGEAIASAVQVSKQIDLSPLQGKNILIVDDDPINRKVLQSILASLGFTSDTAVDGHDAVSRVESENFDIVFMDCSMPNMDGYEATRRVRQLGFEKDIIALTAHAFEKDKKKCTDSGMNHFMTKPVRKEDVEKILMKVIDSDAA